MGLKERIPMVGFPYHASDVYIGKLIDKGYKVAIVEDMNKITLKDSNAAIDAATGEITQGNNDNLIDVLKELFGNAMEIRL